MGKSSRSRNNISSESQIVQTSGEVFADGSAIELIVPKSDGQPRLLFWDQHGKVIAQNIKHLGRVYQALVPHDTLLRAIRFPQGVEDYGTTGRLLTETRGLFEKYLGIVPAEAAMLTAWTCSTWFADIVPSPPTLIVSSLVPSPAITLFRLLCCLCRRAVVLADVNRAGFLSLVPFHPTLLINQPSSSPKFWNLLGASNHRGVYVVGNRGRMFNSVSAKAVFMGTVDTWSDEAIHVAVPPLENVPPLNHELEAEIASRFLPQFLMFRLRKFPKIREFDSSAKHLNLPNTEIARTLTACTEGDLDIAQKIAAILQAQHRDTQERRGCEVGIAIIEALWAPLHEGQEISVTVVAKLTNALLRVRGEFLEYSPSEVGWKLRNLGLERHRSGGGMILQFSKENTILIHQLVQRLGLRLVPFSDCANCTQAGMRAT